MTSLADRTIAALRAEHDATTAIADGLSDAQLSGPSGAAEWTVAAVLSHLGSGAEITLAGLQVALGRREAPAADFNQSVWDRWNAMNPGQQRDGFVEHDATLVAAFEALEQTQRESLELRVGFAPAPLSVAAFGGLRFNESVQHGWDINVSVDPAAGLALASAQVLSELFSGDLAFLLGFIANPDAAPGPVRLEVLGSGYGLLISDSVTLLATMDQPSATFRGPLEAAIRLVTGRLHPEHTPPDVTVTGNITLEVLRTVFPGF